MRNSAWFVVLVLTALLAGAQQKPVSRASASPLAQGQKAFNSACAGCHGLDGRGSDKASNIAKNPEVQQLSDADLAEVIASGIPETGMPAFRHLGEKQIASVVAYLRSLQGAIKTVQLKGNSASGREVFFGKGECANCHAIAGQGRFAGPDLTGYGATASAGTVRDEIAKTSRIPARAYRSAVAVTADGNRLEGVLRNEDNFSAQLQTPDGTFHLLDKSGLRSFETPNQSRMPTDYSQRLSPAELDDLVSFLMSTASPAQAETRPPKKTP